MRVSLIMPIIVLPLRLIGILPVQKTTKSIYKIITALCCSVGLSLSVQAQQDPIFNDAPAAPRGWQPLVRALDALTPKVDTSLALTPKDITDRITALLNNGQNQDALSAIQKRLEQREANAEIGVDVQLLFLQGRAYSQLGQHEKAVESYRQLTVFYPELPEPWNNLATEYMRQHKLDLAKEALDMALLANPQFQLALQNQGELLLMLAHESFKNAGNTQRSKDTEYILQQ